MEISHWKIHRLVSFYLVWARLTVSRLGNCINRFADFEVIWVNGAWKFRRFWNPLNSLNFKDDFQFFRFLNYFHFWNTGKFVSNKGSVYRSNSEQYQTHALFSKISSDDVSKIFNSLGPVNEHRPSHVSKSADMSSKSIFIESWTAIKPTWRWKSLIGLSLWLAKAYLFYNGKACVRGTLSDALY